MKTRLRTQQILVDGPTPESEWWLYIIVQRVDMDEQYNPIRVVDRWGSVNVRLADIATALYPLVDPVSPPAGLISVAGMADGLEKAAVAEIIKKYGGTVDEHGYIMV